MTIGLAQNSNGPLSYQKSLAWYWILLICIAGVVFILGVIFLVYYIRGRGKKSQQTFEKADDSLIGEGGKEVGENELGSDLLDNPLLGGAP